MGILDIFQNKAEHKTWRRLTDAQVTGGGAGELIGKDEAYFIVRMTEMYLQRTRKLWLKFYPLLHGFTTHLGREQHSIAGPGQLKELGESNLDRVMNFNYRLAGPTPYEGDDVVVLAGLYSVPGGDAARALIDTVSTVAGLAGGGLGAAVQITEVVKGGVESLLALDKAALELGVRDTFFPSDNPLMSGYHVALDSSEADVDFDRLWLRDGRLVAGNSPETAQPYDAHDYMVLQIERRASRDDWSGLPGIDGFDERFSDIIASGTLDVAQKKEALRDVWPEFSEAVHRSRDLISKDKERIAASVAADLKVRLEPLPGLDFESVRSVPDRLAPFDFLDVTVAAEASDLESVGPGIASALEANPFTE